MSRQTQPPDPRARRNAVLLVIMLAVLGTIALIAMERFIDDLRELTREDPYLAIVRVNSAIKLLAVSIGLGLAGFAAWLARLSLQAHRTQRFPPPGTRVIRETRVLTGEAARARARLGFGLAAAVAVAGLGLAVYLWHVTAVLAAP